eukprot:TRINITY_DN12194_c0_g2_i1.p1 TRINITY_DN12194_c0_g2~~TRINITY_DN12194_c0_g2_i1.p1  ORF type:complete len:420 (+),score=123.62 TRINITY_DN12194_c0_g2_i1:63-1322(+)
MPGSETQEQVKETVEVVQTDEPPAKKARTEEGGRGAKKKPYAIALGYVGTGYQGLQYNKGFKTIEEDLMNAIHKAGGISADNMVSGNSGMNALQKIGWMRASRTDKGVHAVMNLVSLKLQEPDNNAAFVCAVNEHLPKQIRVYDAVKVTKSFNSKTAVSHRYYNYVLPTFAFLEDFRSVFSPETAMVKIENEEGEEGGQAGNTGYAAIPDEMFEKLKAYRLTDTARARVDKILAEYVGTNWFHNYTKDKPLGDPSAQRYVTEFKIDSIDVIDGMEVATITVKGAAFMIHQIRRMIAMALVTYNAKLGPEYIVKSLLKDTKLGVPTAPPTGLLLRQLIFDFYHKKVSSMRQWGQFGADKLQTLDFKSSEPLMESMHMMIKEEIMLQEKSGRVMACWIRSLPNIIMRYTGINIYEKLAAAE